MFIIEPVLISIFMAGLAFFFCYFHSYLNIMGEIFRFADRQFYRDWFVVESIV